MAYDDIILVRRNAIGLITIWTLGPDCLIFPISILDGIEDGPF